MQKYKQVKMQQENDFERNSPLKNDYIIANEFIVELIRDSNYASMHLFDDGRDVFLAVVCNQDVINILLESINRISPFKINHHFDGGIFLLPDDNVDFEIYVAAVRSGIAQLKNLNYQLKSESLTYY